MLNSIPFCMLIGIVCGLLAGLGVGGGSLLMLWLTAVLQTNPQIARAINLMFFIPASLSVTFFRWKQGKLQFTKILPTILVGCIAAFFGSLITTQLDHRILRKLFGILLLITGLRELFYRRRNAR